MPKNDKIIKSAVNESHPQRRASAINDSRGYMCGYVI